MSEPVFRPLLSLFPLIIFISLAAAAESNDYLSYPNCPPSTCSNLNITYPFYKLGVESASQFCGYQGFGINCSVIDGLERPIIYIGNDEYLVRNISYNYTSIVLVDDDVSDPNPCPRVQHNISIETLPLIFIPTFTVNLSFHFNCTGIFPNFARELPCLSYHENGNNKSSCVNILNPDTERFNWSVYSCEDQVVTTVFRDVINSNGPLLPKDFGKALSRGFELEWGMFTHHEDCDKCQDSEGRCGHHNTRGFMCFCRDGTTRKDHCKGTFSNLFC